MTQLTYFWHQLQSKFRPALIWVGIWTAIGALFAGIFDSFAEQEGIDQFLEAFDPTVLEAFNISSDFLSDIHAFMGGEYFTFYLLAGGIYAVFAGAKSIGGLIEKKTLLYHMTTGLNRFWIYSLRFASEVVVIFFTNLIIAQLVYLSAILLSEADPVEYSFFISAFLSAAMLQFAVFSFGQLIGFVSFLQGRAVAAGAGVVSIMWLLDSIKSIEGYPEILEPLSVYNYVDVSHFIEEYSVLPGDLLLLGLLGALFYLTGVLVFRNQNFSV